MSAFSNFIDIGVFIRWIKLFEFNSQKLLYNLDIALEAIQRNKLRALLTSLGIIFGVASVIAMLAIGSGAQQEVLSQMELLGTNNVIIQPTPEPNTITPNTGRQTACALRRPAAGIIATYLPEKLNLSRFTQP